MRTTTLFSALVLAFATFPLAAQAPASPGSGKAPDCIQMAVGADGKLDNARKSRFSATKILDATFFLRLDRPGDARLDVEVFTPRGGLYQKLTTPVTDVKVPMSATRKVDGYPRPLPLQHLAPGAKSYDAIVSMPVGGTNIMTASLYGTWTARGFVNGEPQEKCTVSFVIVP